MNARRLRIDLFAFALGALALLTLGFFSTRNGAAVVMCGFASPGCSARGSPGSPTGRWCRSRQGLVVILWWVWIDPPADPRQTSALAHGVGGALAGWALAEYLRSRLTWPLWALGALAGVFGLCCGSSANTWATGRSPRA